MHGGGPKSAKQANKPNKRATELKPRTCALQGLMGFRPYYRSAPQVANLGGHPVQPAPVTKLGPETLMLAVHFLKYRCLIH